LTCWNFSAVCFSFPLVMHLILSIRLLGANILMFSHPSSVFNSFTSSIACMYSELPPSVLFESQTNHDTYIAFRIISLISIVWFLFVSWIYLGWFLYLFVFDCFFFFRCLLVQVWSLFLVLFFVCIFKWSMNILHVIVITVFCFIFFAIFRVFSAFRFLTKPCLLINNQLTSHLISLWDNICNWIMFRKIWEFAERRWKKVDRQLGWWERCKILCFTQPKCTHWFQLRTRIDKSR
jgi:hypothetical protein